MKDLTFNNLVSWVFYAVIGFVAVRGVNTLDKLESSVNDLNIKLAQVVTKTDGYDTQLFRQDERIRNLEIKSSDNK